MAPEYSGFGIGKAMMQHLEKLARRSGLKTVHLDATLNAASFYHSLGYVGDKVEPYNNPRGVVMQCIPMRKTL